MKSPRRYSLRAAVCIVVVACALSAPSQDKPAATATGEPSQTKYLFRRKASSKDPTGNGQETVVGKINGQLLMRQSIEEKKPGEFYYNYVLIDGDAVDSITEEGLRFRSGVLFSGYSKGAPPNDVDVIQTGMFVVKGEGMLQMEELGNGGAVFRVRIPSSGTSDGTLLGELRADFTKRTVTVTGAIEVVSSKGLVTIPVESFVKFKAKPAKS